MFQTLWLTAAGKELKDMQKRANSQATFYYQCIPIKEIWMSKQKEFIALKKSFFFCHVASVSLLIQITFVF